MDSSRQDRFESAPEGRASDWIDRYCERGIIALVLLVLVYATLAWGAVRLTEFAMVQGATALVLILWGVRLWANRSLRLFWPPICWAVLAFVVYAIVRCHYVEIAYPARQELNQTFVYAALFFAIVNNVNRRDCTTWICVTLIALGSALVVVAAIQFAGHSPPRIWGSIRTVVYGTRGSGTFINPNHFCALLEMIAPIALSYALMGRFKPTAKVVLAYCACLLVAGICVSVSRGGIVAAAISLTAFLVALLFQRGYRLRAAVMLAAIFLAGYVAVHNADALNRRFASASSDMELRTHIWGIAHQLHQKNIAWGIGPGHFDYEFWPYHHSSVIRLRPGYVHNDYLQTVCEWGVVGMAIIGAALALLFWGIARTWTFVRRDPFELGSRHSSKAAFVLGGGFGLLAVLIHSVSDFNMHIPAVALVAITLMAQLSAQLRFATERFWFNPRFAGRCLLSATVMAGAVWIAFQAQHGFSEQFFLNRAYRQQAWNLQSLADLRSAAEIEPLNPRTLYDLGDCLRCLGDQALPEDPSFSKEALVWLDRAAKIDPYHPLTPMRYGMCLDALDRTAESLPYFERACALDPFGYMEPLYQGRHYMILENYPAAKEALVRSLRIYGTQTALDLLWVIDDRIARIPGAKKL